MNSAIERLLTLHVGDIMAREVVTIKNDENLTDVAKRFEQRQISGAPVVNDEGQCVGVLSGFDFIRQAVNALRDEGTPGQRHVLVQDRPDQPYHLEDFDTDAVDAYMSRDVQSALTTDSMIAAARRMCEQHVHRVVVVDEANKPIGMLSSLDIVAALVAAIEE